MPGAGCRALCVMRYECGNYLFAHAYYFLSLSLKSYLLHQQALFNININIHSPVFLNSFLCRVASTIV